MKRYRPDRDIVPCVPASQEPGPDLLRLEGAAKLAQRLDDWWHSRGFPQVKHTVVSGYRTGKGSASREYVMMVRSNLVNGLPPKEGK